MSGPIFLTDPVNPSHSLNTGRMAWWLAVPGIDGGRQFYDLTGQHIGTLVGFDATSGWKTPYRTGALASGLKLKDVNSYLDCPTISSRLTGRVSASFAVWVNRTPGTTFGIGQGSGANGNTASRFGILWDSTNTIYCLAENAAYYYPNVVSSVSGWVRLLMTYFGGAIPRVDLYFNGSSANLQRSGVGVSPASLASPGSNTFQVGRIDNNGTYAGGAGSFDDVKVWDRTLSATDAFEDFSLSMRGYPGVINRIGPSVATLAPMVPNIAYLAFDGGFQGIATDYAA